MPDLRVLFVVRPNREERIGGDVVMAEETARELRNLGCEVDIVASETPDARGYDIAQIFGVFDPPLAASQFAACRAAGTPIALTPIFWDNTEARARTEAVEKALTKREDTIDARLARIREKRPDELLSRKENTLARSRVERQRALLAQCDLLLANSLIEAYRFNCDLDLQHPRVEIVHMGMSDVPPAPAGIERNGILCVGRVESRKNQAMLVYALRDLDVEIILRGEVYDDYYAALCRRWGTRVRFVDAIPRHEVYELMHRSLVHALPAWWETPGLASLEAAKAGCAIVAGNRGTEVEYFGADAWYCDPGNPESIRSAVVNAMEQARKGLDGALPARLNQFTWAEAAKKTLAAYARVL